MQNIKKFLRTDFEKIQNDFFQEISGKPIFFQKKGLCHFLPYNGANFVCMQKIRNP